MAADPGGAFFVIEEGVWFVQDLYLPKEVLARVGETGAYLRISKGEAHRLGREEPPNADAPWERDETLADATLTR